MKLNLIEYSPAKSVIHFEIEVLDSQGKNLHVYTMDSKKEADSFIRGFYCAQRVANSLIQSMPVDYTIIDKKPKTVNGISVGDKVVFDGNNHYVVISISSDGKLCHIENSISKFMWKDVSIEDVKKADVKKA